MPQQPLVLPVAEYAPDLPAEAGAAVVKNVYPRTPVSYGPVPAPSVYSSAMTLRCQGAAAFRDPSGNINIFAGDANDLYRLTAGSTSFSNVSQSAGGYSTDSDAEWGFAYFNGRLIATNFVDAPQTFLLALDTAFSDLGGSPPRGKYVCVLKNSFVMLGNLFDGADAEQPQRVGWSGAGDAGSWPTAGSQSAAQLQSGRFTLLGDGGAVQGFATDLANADGVVFQEYAVKRVMYVGPPGVFAFLPAENVRGTPSPYSIVTMGGVAYYRAQNGFYAFDGVASRAIGANKIDQTFADDLDQNYFMRVVAAADPVLKLIWWAYPGAGNSGGNPNRLLCYNWQLDRWSLVEATVETIVRVLSIGYTLDELGTVLGYTLDEVPAPLDSAVWTGGNLQLGTFDTDHKLNYLTGTPLAAQVDTAELQPFPGRRSFVSGARAKVDGVGTAPTVSIGRRERLQDAVSYTADIPINALGLSPARTSGRLIRASVKVPASGTWEHISGVEIDAIPQGIR